MSRKYRLLMLTTLIISGCSMCYELIIGAVSSYLLGNSTMQYSITIGLYMAALGLGSYISKFFKKNLFNVFVAIELGIGIAGGMSSLLLFLSNIYISNYAVVMYSETILIGILAGAEIPIMTRIIEEDEKNLSVTLSSIFSFDYIGGACGSCCISAFTAAKAGIFFHFFSMRAVKYHCSHPDFVPLWRACGAYPDLPRNFCRDCGRDDCWDCICG